MENFILKKFFFDIFLNSCWKRILIFLKNLKFANQKLNFVTAATDKKRCVIRGSFWFFWKFKSGLFMIFFKKNLCLLVFFKILGKNHFKLWLKRQISHNFVFFGYGIESWSVNEILKDTRGRIKAVAIVQFTPNSR